MSARHIGGAMSLAAIAVGLAAPAAAQTHRLELADRPGSVSRYRLTLELRIQAELEEGARPDREARSLIEALGSGIRMHTVTEYDQELERVEEDGTRVFEVRWRDYRFEGRVGDKPVPPPTGHTEAVRDLLARPARVRTTSRGRTLNIDYGHPDLARLAGGAGGPGGAVPAHLPDRPIAVGERWRSVAELPIDLPGGGTRALGFDLEHTLREVRSGPDGPIAVIGFEGSYSRSAGTGDGSEAGLPSHLEATLGGSALFDIRRGRFVGGRYEMDMFALHSGPEGAIELVGRADGRLELVEPR
jgi:hypothetical protein